MKFFYLCIMFSIGLMNPVFAEEDKTTTWSWIKDKTSELSESVSEAASSTSSFINKSYSSATEGSAAWTRETYNLFSSDYPEIALNIESFRDSSVKYSQFAYEKTKDGAIVAYDVTLDGAKIAVDWTSEKINKLPEVKACDIAGYDFLGGAAIGTLGTALAAGVSTTTTVVEVWAITSTLFSTSASLLSSISVVAVPAIAVGVTATALVGATVYATSKGICYYQKNTDLKRL